MRDMPIWQSFLAEFPTQRTGIDKPEAANFQSRSGIVETKIEPIEPHRARYFNDVFARNRRKRHHSVHSIKIKSQEARQT